MDGINGDVVTIATGRKIRNRRGFDFVVVVKSRYVMYIASSHLPLVNSKIYAFSAFTSLSNRPKPIQNPTNAPEQALSPMFKDRVSLGQ